MASAVHMPDWLTGCLFLVLGAPMLNFALAFMKMPKHADRIKRLSGPEKAEDSVPNQQAPLESLAATVPPESAQPADAGDSNSFGPAWWIGLAYLVMGIALTVLSLPFAPLSVLAPLSVIQLPGALLLERILIGRRFSGAQLTALLGLLAGCALLVVSVASPAYAQPSGLDPFDIMHYFTTVPFLVLLGIMFVVSTLSCVYGQWLVCRAKRLPIDAPTSRTGPSRDLAAFMATLPIAVLCTVAIIFLKLLAEIVRSRVLGLWWDMLDILPIALGIFGGAAVALAWLMLDAACFKFDPVEILPSLQACWLLFTMLAGGLMFEEFDQQTELWQSACYLTGLFLAAICSLFLTASILCRPIGGPAPAPAPVTAAGASKGVPDLAAPRSAQNIVDSIDQSRKQRWWPCTIFVVFPAPPFFDVDEIGRLQARAAAQAPRRPSQAYAAPL